MPAKSTKTKLVNHVAVVLDESGSMEPLRREAIDAFNEQVQAIHTGSVKQETTVSLVKFSTEVPEPVYWEQPVASMMPITSRDYRPSGMTALLDAIGLTLDRLTALPDADDANTSFLVIIISDGEENNSKKFTHNDIADRIQKLEAGEHWTFVYMGANQDLMKVAREFKITVMNVASFDASPGGVMSASSRISEGISRHMRRKGMGLHASKDFFADTIEDEPADTDKKK